MVVARFQGNVHDAAPGLGARLLQRDYLGVPSSGRLGAALADDLAAVHHNGADRGVRAHAAQGAPGEGKSAAHRGHGV